MKRNCILLEEMVEEILDFSRLEDNRFVINKEDFNIAALLNETSQDMLPLVEKKNLKLTVKVLDEAVNVFADRSRIRQVIVNLINNSIKYTDIGEIETGLIKDDKNVTVYVKDTGIGIAEDDKKKIFERFYRVDNEHTRRTPGFGIGLTLCRFIIEDNHSGRLWFESEINKGSTFFFSIPLNNIVKKE
jgi:signal transduction histidine kinase